VVVSKLASGLRDVVKKIAGASMVDEKFVKEAIKDLQRTLITADVNVKLVFELSKRIEERVLKAELPRGISQKEYFMKVVYEELVDLMGKSYKFEPEAGNILLVGLYGQGKTTTAAKLARVYQKHGMKVAMICTDTWRPAAFEQLKQLSEQIKVPVHGDAKEKGPVKILEEGLEKFKGYKVIIVDSAGRDDLNEELVEELKAVNRVLKPDESLLVMGGDMGQIAGKQAKSFQDSAGVTGVILTRMDSSAKGGGAISACAETGAPIKFMGTGEKTDDFEAFDPEKYVSRLLGFPDIGALMKKVKEAAEESQITPDELLKGKFTLKTFYRQLEATQKMGPLSKVLEMLGVSAQMPDELVDESEERLKAYKVIMDSMTEQELENPGLLDSSRIERIARGSGRKPEEVRELRKQYKMMKKMMSKVKKGKRMPKNIAALMRQFGMK
jgi:signal recognition particle subunit SRP54